MPVKQKGESTGSPKTKEPPIDEETRNIYWRAVAKYCYNKKIRAGSLKVNKEVVCEIIPYVAEELPEWEMYGIDNFDYIGDRYHR